MRVLLVEDDELNVELFTDLLEADGHEVAVERDGLAGRTRALAERFDLHLLDIQLPGQDGLSLCRGLRASGLTRPIVALSSDAMPEQIERGSAAGFDDYLTKPVSPAALRATVRRYGGAGTTK